MWNMEKQEKTLIGMNYNWKFQCRPLIFKGRNCVCMCIFICLCILINLCIYAYLYACECIGFLALVEKAK